LIDSTGGDLIFTSVEQLPEFSGGEHGLMTYVIEKLQSAGNRKSCREQLVIASFIINEDGSISEVKIVEGTKDQCNRIVIDIISDMPLWRPGKFNGRVVKERCMLPIKF
jgi:hypothetical protein